MMNSVVDGLARTFPYVFVDGELVEAADACVTVHANALSYGTGTFEGIRAFSGDDGLHLLSAPEHFSRLQQSALILGLTLRYSMEQLLDASVRLLQKNDVREDAYLRPLLVLNEETLHVRTIGLTSRFSIAVHPMGLNYINPKGVRCIVSTWRRAPDLAIPSRAKTTGGYIGPALAKSEALAAGADEAIMLNMEGHVAEATTSNIFLRFGSRWMTPPPYDDILPGITRTHVMRLIEELMGEPVVECSIDRSQLYVADEMLLCGTAALVVPVIAVDGRPIGPGVPGSRTLELQQTLMSICRRQDSRHAEWLTNVPGRVGVGF